VLAHQVLLLLSPITEVSGGRSSENLARWHSDSFWDDSASGNDSEGFDLSAAANACPHTNEGVVFESASVQADISTNVDVLADRDFITGLLSVTANAGQILDRRVLSNVDFGGVTTDDNAMPEGAALAKLDVTDNCSVRCNPVALKS